MNPTNYQVVAYFTWGRKGPLPHSRNFCFYSLFYNCFVTYVYGARANANYYECQDTNKYYYSKRVLKTFIVKILLIINNKFLSTCHRTCLTRANINSLTDQISSAWTSTSWSALGRLVNHAAFAAPSRQHLHWFFLRLSWTCGRTSFHDARCDMCRTHPAVISLGLCTSSNVPFHLLSMSWRQRIDTSRKKNFPNNGQPQCGQEGLWHS